MKYFVTLVFSLLTFCFLQAQPGSISSVQSLRSAMGVSYQSSDSSQTAYPTSQLTSQPINQSDLSTEFSTNQSNSSLQTSVSQPVNQLQTSAAPVVDQPATVQTSYPSNIPNIISHHGITSSYQSTTITPTTTLIQQTQILQPTSITYQMANVIPSTSVTFQQANIIPSTSVAFQQANILPSTSVTFQQANNDLFNSTATTSDLGTVVQAVQNDTNINSGVTTINDDDSDIEMDISEFLQFPSS